MTSYIEKKDFFDLDENVEKCYEIIRCVVRQNVRNFPYLFSFMSVEDVVQEVWLKVINYRTTHQWDESRGKSLFGYIKMITYQRITDLNHNANSRKIRVPGHMLVCGDAPICRNSYEESTVSILDIVDSFECGYEEIEMDYALEGLKKELFNTRCGKSDIADICSMLIDGMSFSSIAKNIGVKKETLVTFIEYWKEDIKEIVGAA